MPLRIVLHGARPWLWVLLVTLLPMLLGLPLLRWQAERDLQAQASSEVALALQRVTAIIDNAASAARTLAPLAGQPCPGATLALREQVTANPFVRSTGLAAGGELYCTSLYGPYQERFSPDDYVDGRLRLVAGNTLTPGRPMLVYRATAPAGSALASVDGQHLANVLAPPDSNSHVILTVGPAWMDDRGVLGTSALPPFEVGEAQGSSARYPLLVTAGYERSALWRRLGRQYPLLALLALLGLGAGGCCRWLQRRAGSQRQELRRAVAAGEFIPFFQPLASSTDGTCTGTEVLMRWRHPREGLVRPDLFIPYAEASGLIIPMTRSLMRQAATALAALADSLPEGFHVGFNITASHCQDPTLLADCQRFLAAFPPGRVQLVLELTERQLVSPTPDTLALFSALRRMGVKIALDDFGTGQSSLAYLHQFNVDFLKIDRSFVSMIGSQALGRHILDSIIELCAKLHLEVIAEGVETQDQQRYLAERGVAYLQGYYFGKPMPADLFTSSINAAARRGASSPLASAAELG